MAKAVTNPNSRDDRLPPESIIFGKTEAMATVRRSLLKVADTNIPILIEGESGTGKEIICKYLHQHSVWGRGPFVKVNCPAIPGTLLESELFGYERGAFTGALRTKAGWVEMAERGTLFLDEISELDLSLQSKLLQVLQDGQFKAIGSTTDKKVSVRVICATNRQLHKEVAKEHFRQDLYYRITGMVLRLPPLRERLQDLRALADYFVALHNEQFKCNAPPISESSLRSMSTHPWTGNIRELENLTKRYVVVGNEEAILSEIGQRKIGRYEFAPGYAAIEPNSTLPLGQLTRAAVRELESKIILDSLRANQWNRKLTARALKVSYRSLLYKLKKAGIENRRGAGSVGAEPNRLEKFL
jgi:two-component system response regulator AtoC